MIYEAPGLTQIGKAEEVIRGTYLVGTDLDGHEIIGEFEFLTDDSAESGIPAHS